jgi:very-short-patch-repair endonuclease
MLDAGLPAPVPQFRVMVNGRERFRLDLAYPELKICIEYDGEQFHSSPEDRARDRARREWLRRHGWIVIVVTKADLRRDSTSTWLHDVRRAVQARTPVRMKPRYARAERAARRKS